MTEINERFGQGLGINRIEGLTDGIFAIAMTLLVLAIDFPKEGMQLTPDALRKLLFGQGQEFYNYALSFILLANFWTLHHQLFHFFRATDAVHLWINILQLMFVALVPFSSSVAGDFPDQRMAQFIFGINMLFIGMLFLVNWLYAVKKHRLVDGRLAKSRIHAIAWKVSIIPIVSVIAIMVALLSPRGSSYVYATIPFLLVMFYGSAKTGE